MIHGPGRTFPAGGLAGQVVTHKAGAASGELAFVGAEVAIAEDSDSSHTVGTSPAAVSFDAIAANVDWLETTGDDTVLTIEPGVYSWSFTTDATVADAVKMLSVELTDGAGSTLSETILPIVTALGLTVCGGTVVFSESTDISVELAASAASVTLTAIDVTFTKLS